MTYAPKNAFMTTPLTQFQILKRDTELYSTMRDPLIFCLLRLWNRAYAVKLWLLLHDLPAKVMKSRGLCGTFGGMHALNAGQAVSRRDHNYRTRIALRKERLSKPASQARIYTCF